jgi:hypothetical protein
MKPHESLIYYHRCGRLLRFSISTTLTDGELGEIVAGLFARIGVEDRARLLQECLLIHSDPEAFLSQRASAVARALMGDQVVSLDAVAPMFHAELPRVR